MAAITYATGTGSHPPFLKLRDVSAQATTGQTDWVEVPDWAKSIGHADKWKLHHNCK